MQVEEPNISLSTLQNRNSHPELIKTFLIRDAVSKSVEKGRLPIYACDKKRTKRTRMGAKEFYAGSYDKFYQLYDRLPTSERCFYETILSEFPCHLYVDVEGDKDLNADVDFPVLCDKIFDELKMFIVYFFKEALQDKDAIFCKEDIKMIELDSSTETKFSRHYIIKIKNGEYMFANNFHCGALMRRFQKHIIQKYGGPTTKTNPFFHFHSTEKSEEDIMVFMIDMGVYTLRRQFRLVGSAKRKGKKRRELWVTGKPKKLSKELFLECLVQYISPVLLSSTTLKTIRITEPNGRSPISSSLRSFDSEGNPISIVSGSEATNLFRESISTNGYNSILKGTKGKQLKMTEYAVENKRQRVEYGIATSLQGLIRDYFKRTYGYTIHSYTVSVNRMGTKKIKLETYDTRCMNKKRKTNVESHKTNHVYFVIYPETLVHFQGCYDNDYCRNEITHLGRITDSHLIAKLQNWNVPGVAAESSPKSWLPIE